MARHTTHRRRRPHLRRTDLRRGRSVLRGMARHASHRRHGGVSDRAAGGSRSRCRPSAVALANRCAVHPPVRLPGQHRSSGRRGSVHRPLRHRLLQHLRPSPHGGLGRRVDQRQRSVRRVHHQRGLLLGRAHSQPGPVRRLDVSRLPSRQRPHQNPGVGRPPVVKRLHRFLFEPGLRVGGPVARRVSAEFGVPPPALRRRPGLPGGAIVHVVSFVGRVRAAG